MHRRWLFGIIVAIIVLAATACTPPSPKGSPGPATTEPTAVAPTAAMLAPTPAPTLAATPKVTVAAIATAATSGTPAAEAVPAGEVAVKPGASQAAPSPLKVGVVKSVNAGGEGWFVVDVPNGAVLTLTLTPAKAAQPMRLTVYDSQQGEVKGLEAAPGIKESLKLRMNTSSGGKYTVQLIGLGEFALETAIAPQDDAKSKKDAADALDEATEIALGANYAGQVGDYDEEDFYAFDIDAGQVLEVSFCALEDSEGPTVQLLGPGKSEEWGAYSVSRGDIESTRMVLGADSAGQYYLTVWGTGSYTFTVRASAQNDGASGGDAGDEVGDAVTIQAGKVITGELGGWDMADWYILSLGGGQIVSLRFTLAKGGQATNVHFYDEDKDELVAEYSINPGQTKTLNYVLDDAAQGDYYVAVAQGAGPYTFELKAEPQDDADTGADAGRDRGSAAEIEPGGPYVGLLGGDDREDFYAFPPTVGQEISFTPAKGCAAVNFFVLDADGDEMWAEWDATPNEAVSTTLENVNGEPYYLQVSGGPCNYTFGIAE